MLTQCRGCHGTGVIGSLHCDAWCSACHGQGVIAEAVRASVLTTEPVARPMGENGSFYAAELEEGAVS
jgi:DnaJ-class molecular chaperone